MTESGWRTLLIQTGTILRYEEGQLTIEQEGLTERVPLAQIRCLIIDDLCTKIGTALINRLAESNVSVMICDSHHQPSAEINAYSSYACSAGKLQRQAKWKKAVKTSLWKDIVHNKIFNQYSLLRSCSLCDAEKLYAYLDALSDKNVNSAEAASAKVYFSALFGKDFVRHTVSDINSALNYGYSIIMSQTSRSIASYGYHSALGIHHHSESNPYNLSCDLMELFRPVVDRYVSQHVSAFTQEYRCELIKLMYSPVWYNNMRTELQTAIDMYVRDCIRFMEHETDKTGEVRICQLTDDA